MGKKRANLPLTSTITGKLQVTIPARLARKLGIRTGTRLEWKESKGGNILSARILPDPVAGLEEARSLAAKNKPAAVKLSKSFPVDRANRRVSERGI